MGSAQLKLSLPETPIEDVLLTKILNLANGNLKTVDSAARKVVREEGWRSRIGDKGYLRRWLADRAKRAIRGAAAALKQNTRARA